LNISEISPVTFIKNQIFLLVLQQKYNRTPLTNKFILLRAFT
ncbi:unnamed protein product, partial [Gulo gulo]